MTDTPTPGAAPAAPAKPSLFTSPDSRGWNAIGLYVLTASVLGLLAWKPELKDNSLFSMLAQAIVISGLINGAVQFFYGASKDKAPDPAKPA